MTEHHKTIIFTGGGSAGHVTPNLALMKRLQQSGWQVMYIGSANGIEKEIITRINVPYYSIAAGKLRRQLDWRNLLTPFQVIAGIFQAFRLCRKLKANIVFSKGGFVAFPVVVGAWLSRIPVIAHESDLTPGLANRLSFPFVKKICVTFPEGKNYFSNQKKVQVTGTPIREELLLGQREKGLQFCGFKPEKPVLMVIGGGLGSAIINQRIRNILPQLLKTFQVIHICGNNKTTHDVHDITGYQQFDYVNEALPDMYACADIVVSRAGANTIYELLALHKPHLLIPLSTKASRGDQIINAQYYADQGISMVLAEEKMDNTTLYDSIMQLHHNTDIQQQISQFVLPDAVATICQLIETTVSA